MSNKNYNKFYKPDERMLNEVLYFKGIENAWFSYNPDPGNMANSQEMAFCFEGTLDNYFIKYVDLRENIEKVENIHDAVKIFMENESEIGFWTSCSEEDVYDFLNNLPLTK